MTTRSPGPPSSPSIPLMLRGLGVVIGSDLIAGVLISLAAFAIALVLLYELVCLELDSERARVTVMLVAFCPMAYFFSAVYSESLYLALSVGCILAARRGRWAWAGLLRRARGGLAQLRDRAGRPGRVAFPVWAAGRPAWERSPGGDSPGRVDAVVGCGGSCPAIR